MVDARAFIGLVLAASGCALLGSVPGLLFTASPSPALPSSALHPVASLAWAQAHCDSALRFSADSARLQAEDFFQSNGELAAIQQRLGHAAACDAAIASATVAAADPQDGGSPELRKATAVALAK